MPEGAMGGERGGLLRKAYGSLNLDLAGALQWIRALPGTGRLGTA